MLLLPICLVFCDGASGSLSSQDGSGAISKSQITPP